MINRFFFFILALVFLVGSTSSGVASYSLLTHTQLTPKLKPASFLELGNSYQIASVCFLGSNCGSGNNSKDYQLDTTQQCKNEGYNITSCSSPEIPYVQCPYNDGYFKECKNINGEKCRNEGFVQSCPEGSILDETQVCPYDNSYKKCKCNPCEGYDYTYAEATSEGYILGASCNSCGTTKYQRQNAPCSGFLSCDCGGGIGASTCKSGTNTLFSQCKECVKCDDECPSGYYKTAGGTWGYVNGIGRDICWFSEKTSQTECGTTCYQCQPPEKQFSGGEYCYSTAKCPEGYSFDESTHDYVCNPLTCQKLVLDKYPSYFFSEHCSGIDGNGNSYNFDKPYIGCNYSNTPFLFTQGDTITQSFYRLKDFADEFPECKNYCRYGFDLRNKTFKGENLFMSLTYDDTSRNITIDGNVKVPYTGFSYGFDIDGLTLKEGAVFENESGHLDNIIAYPGSTLIGGKVGNMTVVANTADKPVTLQKTTSFNGVITSANYYAGSNGGFYLHFKNSPSIEELTINRNPGGEIIIEPKSEKGHIWSTRIFKNPGTDTKVILPKVSGGRVCLLSKNDTYSICSTETSEVIITYKTDNVSEQVLPKCCSGNGGCPESQWNGTVVCTGEAYCNGDCSY